MWTCKHLETGKHDCSWRLAPKINLPCIMWKIWHGFTSWLWFFAFIILEFSFSRMCNTKKQYFWSICLLLNFNKIVIANIFIRVIKISLSISRTKLLTYLFPPLNEWFMKIYFINLFHKRCNECFKQLTTQNIFSISWFK